MGHGRHVLVASLAAVIGLAFVALADQGAPVYTAIEPTPVAGTACTGAPERVQIVSGSSAIIFCCDAGLWVDCTPGGGGAAPANGTYLVTTSSPSLSAEVVVPACSPGDALTYDGASVTCFTPAGGGGGAPTDATYLTMGASAGLSAEVVVPTCAAGDALTSNGTAVSCFTPAGGGGGATSFVDAEIPTGTLDGSNTAFTVATAPSPATSLRVYVNGVRLRPTTDYTLTGTALSMAAPPQVGDWFYVDYRYGSVTNFADAEVPSGTIDGSNPTFTLAHSPTAGSLAVYLNGIRLRPTTDYSVTGSTLTMTMLPQTGDWFHVDYRY